MNLSYVDFAGSRRSFSMYTRSWGCRV